MALIAIVCLPLGRLAWHHSRQYVDVETLYRTTIARNPECWMAYNNLGAIKLRGTLEEVREGHELIVTSVAIYPNNAEARNNLGYALQRQGKFEEALVQHDVAIRLLPTFADAHNSRGVALRELGRLQEAEREFREAIRLKPGLEDCAPEPRAGTDLAEPAGRSDAGTGRGVSNHTGSGGGASESRQSPAAIEAVRRGAHTLSGSRADPAVICRGASHVGFILQRLGRWAEAAAAYREALRAKPDSVRTEDGLGYVLLRMGRPDEARQHLENALRLAPADAAVHFNLANALLDLGRVEQSVDQYRQALKYEPPPGAAETHNNLGIALAQLGRLGEATEAFKEALRIDPNFDDARVNLARARGK